MKRKLSDVYVNVFILFIKYSKDPSLDIIRSIALRNANFKSITYLNEYNNIDINI